MYRLMVLALLRVDIAGDMTDWAVNLVSIFSLDISILVVVLVAMMVAMLVSVLVATMAAMSLAAWVRILGEIVLVFSSEVIVVVIVVAIVVAVSLVSYLTALETTSVMMGVDL